MKAGEFLLREFGNIQQWIVTAKERIVQSTGQSPSVPRIERLPAVLARVGLSRSYVYAAVARGDFPQPLKIGRATGWDSRAIDAWIDSRPAASTSAVQSRGE